MKKIAIIGSGISGVSASSFLADLGINHDIYESDPITGGLIHCSLEKDNILFHRIGGHVFNSKDQVVLDWFWSKFDRDSEFIAHDRNAAVFLNQSFINYPIEYNIHQLERNQCKKIVGELLNLFADISNGSQYKHLSTNISDLTFKQFLLKSFGKTLCELYFFPYNEKIWNSDLCFPIEWLQGKLPMPNHKEIIQSLVLRDKDTKMVHTTFFYPRSGGSQFIINKLLRGKKIINNYNVDSVKYANSNLVINNQHYSHIIYTGSIKKLPYILDKAIYRFSNEEKVYLNSLKSNKTSNLLCECDANPYSWMYIPSPEIKAHRIIFTGNFSANNNGKLLTKNRTTCTVEFTGEYSLEFMISEIEKLPFNMRYIASNRPKTSYIIQDSDTRDFVSNLRKKLEASNFFLCGRFAEWEYYNMDAAIKSVLNTCHNINQ